MWTVRDTAGTKSPREVSETVQRILARSRTRQAETPKTLAEMTANELAEALRDAEAQRKQIKLRHTPEASHTKDWARRRKAAIRAEYKHRGLTAPHGGTFCEWAGVGVAS